MNEYWTSLASLLGVLAFSRNLISSIFPPEIRFVFLKLFNRFFQMFSTFCYFDITEIDGVNTNELYNAVQLYLSSSVSDTGNRFSLTRAVNSSSITFGLSNNASIVDTFNAVTVVWQHTVTQRQTQAMYYRPMPEENRGFTLRIKKKDRSLILDSYLDYIMEKANEIRRKNQDRLLYTNSRGMSMESIRGNPWESVPFKHPSTFETLAMDPVKKKQIMEDLRDFAECQSFYQNTGRAWKRGYLLYGPPGTGKSSMIAAMANYLRYDIYDLELTNVNSNSELRRLLMKTSSKSIILIEDIDCSINLSNRRKKVSMGMRPFGPAMLTGPGLEEDSRNGNTMTLSGLLNFTDGLWSCCGSERIFVFTTNHIEKLDPALLRSGRMDMHIFMSYCTFPSLKILLKNYLGYEEDLNEDVLKKIEQVVDKAEITPADVSEILIKHKRDRENAVKELLVDLESRAENNEKNGILRGQNGSMEEITRADVSEILIKNGRDRENALKELLVGLESRVEKNENNGKLRGRNGSLEEITPADVSETLIMNKREKAMKELLVDLDGRVEKNEKNGKLRGQNGSLEEHEKKALDNPHAEEIEDNICKNTEETEDNICKNSDDY